MINIEEVKTGDVIKCGTGKAIVTFIDDNEICIVHEWGETDRLKECHFKYWDNTGIKIPQLKDILTKLNF